jgi:hypothetical protein
VLKGRGPGKPTCSSSIGHRLCVYEVARRGGIREMPDQGERFVPAASFSIVRHFDFCQDQRSCRSFGKMEIYF